MDMVYLNTTSLGNLLGSSQQSILWYVEIVVMIIGIVMVGVGIYQVAKNLISHGKGQTSWVTTILLLFIGAIFAMVSGWASLGNVISVGQGTLNELAGGSADTTGTVSNPFENSQSSAGDASRYNTK